MRRRHLAEFDQIKPPRPPCALLVTSRRYDLPLPGPAIKNLDVLPAKQARELLSTRIPEAWLDAEADATEAVCELVEYIPLALTLAARRAERIAKRQDETADHPLATLLDELQARRIRVLNQGEDPNRPDLSVVITFDASADDPDPPDQARLRRLGVFARNEFELPALMAVWGDDEVEARQALERLVNAGLVEEVARDTWWMHDLLREYAAERLGKDDPGEEQAARLAHVAYWKGYLESLEPRRIDEWRDLESHRNVTSATMEVGQRIHQARRPADAPACQNALSASSLIYQRFSVSFPTAFERSTLYARQIRRLQVPALGAHRPNHRRRPGSSLHTRARLRGADIPTRTERRAARTRPGVQP